MTIETPSPGQHRILMIFTSNHARTQWEAVFRKPPTPRPLGKTYRLADPEKLRELHRQFGTDRLSEDRQALEFAIQQGHGTR